MNAIDDYIVAKLQSRFRVSLEVDRSFELEKEQQSRCLSPVGEAIFNNAVRLYLARRREEAGELVAKSRAFLELAHSIGEKQKYNYTRYFSESLRSSALSFGRWLSTGEVDEAILADARSNLDGYYSRSRTLDRGSAALGVPVLLYTEAYAVIVKIAERLSIGLDPSSPRKATGLFGHALRIALAANDEERRAEQERLRKRAGKQLFVWIDRGHYGDVAYMLYALFPRPNGPPYRLIEECWQYIPEDVVSKRLAEMRSLGLITEN